MSLSDLFKPWNWFWFACGPPLPNVALVLQYLQALRVSSDAITIKKKKKKEEENLNKLFFFFLRVQIPAGTHKEPDARPGTLTADLCRSSNQDFRIEFRY